MYQLRTIDVWDTLLRRTCHPDFIKLATARYLILSEYQRLDTPFREHWAIFKERCRIEGELAAQARNNGGDDEYTLKDVLSHLLHNVLSEEFKEQKDISRLSQRLAEQELEFEYQNTYVDSECRKFLSQFPASKSLFLSDFYMPADSLRGLLQHHGLQDIVNEGISSCDVQMNKRSGNLFKHIQEILGISPERHVHVGDNTYSDIEVPRRMGINVQLYQPATEHGARVAREQLFAERGALFSHIEREALESAKSTLEDSSEERRSAFLLGVYTAPMLVGFLIFIAERTILDKPDKLFFFTREGEFFERVFHKLFPDLSFAGMQLPAPRLLEVSRLATFCASLQDISPQEMMRLWNLYSTQSMVAFFKSLGLDPEPLNALCTKHQLELTAAVTYPWQDERVIRLFADPEFRTIIADKIAVDRANLMAYLRHHDWNESDQQVSIVDIGWRGTIQDNLALLFPTTKISGYYLGLQQFLNDQPANGVKHAFGPNLNEHVEYSQLLDSVAPIETICNSPHGSVTSYQSDQEHHVRAERLVDADENAVYERFTRHFQDGVLLAASCWARYIDNHALASQELRDIACKIWTGLIAKPPEQLLKAFTSLNHNETFGVGGFVDKKEVPGTLEIMRNVFSQTGRQELIFFLKKNQWPRAFWQRQDIGFLNKAILIALMLTAQFYKRLRSWQRRQALWH